MTTVFLKLFNLSVTASWLILAVILVRFVLKKAPKWINCLLWGLVAIRLICPVSFKSVLSLIPSSETVPENIEMMSNPAIESGIGIVDKTVNNAMAQSLAPGIGDSANPLQIVMPLISAVWIIGVIALLVYAVFSFLKLKKSVSASLRIEDNIMACDDIKSPFILGILKPVIYIPSSMEAEMRDYVIIHEKAHIKRRDHWWKPLGYLLLAVYWFNPLCWVAYSLLCRDIEMACDEKVVLNLNDNERADYSQALLDCSFPRRKIAACPLAFGEVGVKKRIKAVLNFKKPTFWIILTAVVSCVLIVLCFMTNPYSKMNDRLKTSMDMAVAEHNHFKIAENAFITCDYNVLRISESDNKTAVYATVFYAEYVYDELGLHSAGGSYTPAVITFDTQKGSDVASYEAVEYWTPRDGTYYAKDIFSKFPASLWLTVFSDNDIKKSEEKCNTAAREYYGLPDDVKIDKSGKTAAKAEASEAKNSYLSFMEGNRGLLEENQTEKWDIPDFGKDTFQYEYLIRDLDNDTLPELIVQMKNDPAGYNGVFHYENGKIVCWQSDTIEMSCRDYPLIDGTMVRQYDYNGSSSYTIFCYNSDGSARQLFTLFKREESVYDDGTPCPYYEADGKEITATEFGKLLTEKISDKLFLPQAWKRIENR
ncbi:MAG: hypothetical protein KBS52_01435 [Clostridiales bacterium]|nr:hypothetical protein [Candidatus Equinaster intestinalis]